MRINLENEPPLSRRALIGLAGAGALGLAVGQADATTLQRPGALPDVRKTGTPEGEIGPYFADDSAKGFHRSNIVANIDGTNPQPGIPLTLKITVYDTKAECAPVHGAQVDIWHCNASGRYSDTPDETGPVDTFLRGYQLTDAAGHVTFQTIFPGWYEGRTTHIHLRIRSKYSQASSTSDDSNTTQLFFPQPVIDAVYASTAPYSRRGAESTTNADDMVYMPQTHAQTVVSLSGSQAAGFVATAAIYLPITRE